MIEVMTSTREEIRSILDDLKEAHDTPLTDEQVKNMRAAWIKLDKEIADNQEKEKQQYNTDWKRRQELLNRPFDM